MEQAGDLKIAQEAELWPVQSVAEAAGIPERALECYGRYKAKVNVKALPEAERVGKVILVTAITPTAAGEGKTTVSVGLADGLASIGKRAMVALREPSLGPVFGVKGGAAGGGYAQVIPMEDINLHFTGDMHAIGAANNLLAAMLDNHIQQGNALDLDVKRIAWKRTVDMNDRQLRHIVSGLGGMPNGMPREDGFDITVASEVMAVLCLAENLTDLKRRLGTVIVGYTRAGKPVTAADLKAHGAMAALLRDAVKPNLVQTLAHTPALIHGGPFANIAHGCNSVIATKTAMRLADYVVTEAGFGADLGAEKFLDIKCRQAGIQPSAVVIVATARALKLHGGAGKTELAAENLGAIRKGICNLFRHVRVISETFRLPCVVAMNRFATDSEAELALIETLCANHGIKAVRCNAWAEGGSGAAELAAEVVRLCDVKNEFRFAYDDDMPLREKLRSLVRCVYGGADVRFSAEAEKKEALLRETGLANLPVCVAKTQYSFSDDPALLGAPEGFTVTVRDLKACAGAGFIVAYTGAVMTMPGLPKSPAAERIDVDSEGNITGLF